MLIYSRSIIVAAGVLTGAPIAQIYPNAAASGFGVAPASMRIREIRVSQRDTTSAQIALIRSATLGTPTNAAAKKLGVCLYGPESMPASQGMVVDSWSAAPTIAGTPAYLQTYNLPGVLGAGIVWDWEDDDNFSLTENATGGSNNNSILIWNTGGTAGALDVAVQWAE